MRYHIRPVLAIAAAAAVVLITLAPVHAAPQLCSGGVVALRFDDGPVPETAQLLDALKASKLRATFFVIGSQVEKHPDLARRMVQEGHEIANHSWSHVALAELTPQAVWTELKATQDIVYKTTGFRPRFAGPPYGSTSDTVRSVMSYLGVREVLKSRDSGDWNGAPAWDIMNKLTLVPPGGIYLMHDWAPNIASVVPLIAWHFNTYWQKSPICAGRISATTEVNPVLDWMGQYYHAEAVQWPRR